MSHRRRHVASTLIMLALSACGQDGQGDFKGDGAKSKELGVRQLVAQKSTNGTFVVHPANNLQKCVDVRGANPTNGTAVQIYDCNGSEAQSFSIKNGRLKVLGNKCVDITNGAAKNGTLLQIWDCAENNVNQHFVVTQNQIAWKKANFCIDLKDGSDANAQQLQIWQCTANDKNQMWSMTSNTASSPTQAPAPPVSNNPASGTTSSTPSALPGWALVWSDEFEGTSVDLSKWNYEVNCDGGGNDEQECYTNRAQNSYIDNGSLIIKVIKENYNGKPYTSARLNTAGKGDWILGRFETRLKVPCGQGFWPAAWMMPQNSAYGSWPTSGELDIMEILGGSPQTWYGTAHFGPAWPNNLQAGGQTTMQSGNFCLDYHVFAIERYEDHVNWFVDNQLQYTLNKTAQNWSPAPHWPFDQPFFFILNVAMGGNWPGAPDASIQSGQMSVDYVRVYQKS